MNIEGVDKSALNASEIAYVGSFIRDKYPREKDFYSIRSCVLNPEDIKQPITSAILQGIVRLNHLSETCSIDSLAHFLMTEGLISTQTNDVMEQPKTWSGLCDLLDHYARFGAKSIKDFRLRERVCKEAWRTDKLNIKNIEKIIKEVEAGGGSSLDMAFAIRNYTEQLIGETESVNLVTTWDKQQELFDEIPKSQRELLGKPRFTFPNHWQLNSYVSCLRPGEMIVLSGDSGGGKSSMAMMFSEWCCAIGKNVLVIHLEDYASIILQRQCVRWIGGTLGELERGDPNNLMQKMKSLRQQWADKRGGSITYRYLAGYTMPLVTEQIKETARELEAEGLKLDVVVLDYFQKIDFESEIGRGQNYVNSASAGAEMLKIVTQKLKITTMVVSQETDDGQGNKHVAWSRALSQKSQVHLSLTRHEIKKSEERELVYLDQYGKEPITLTDVGEKSCWLKVDIKKANNGKTGTKYLFFDAPHFKAYDKQFMTDVRAGRRKQFELPILSEIDETFVKDQKQQLDIWDAGWQQLDSPDQKRK